MMRSLTLLIAVLLVAGVSMSAMAHASGNRHAKAHTHGKGKLNIAVEGNKVSLALEAPGADIVGFEHEAKTDKQKAAIESAKAKLSDALALFKPSASAGCSLSQVKVEVKAEDAIHKPESEKHSEFHAEILLDCKAPANITTIAFDYFKTFPKADELDVTVISPKGQNTYSVSRKKPTLQLAGIS